METLIDDPPPPQGDWNKPHEDPRTSSHRRRRKKEKSKHQDSPSGESRKREKMETAIDDPPMSHNREPKVDESTHHTSSSKPGRTRRKEEPREESSSSRRQQEQELASPQARETRTQSSKSSKRHEDFSRPYDGEYTKEDEPSPSGGRRKPEDDSSTSPHRKHRRGEDEASTSQQNLNQNNEDLCPKSSRTKESSTAALPNILKNPTTIDNDDAATQETRKKKEKKKKKKKEEKVEKKEEKSEKDEFPKHAKEITKMAADIDTVKQPSTQIKAKAEIDTQHQRPHKDESSTSPQRKLQETEEEEKKERKKTFASPQHRSELIEEEKSVSPHRKLQETRKEKASASPQRRSQEIRKTEEEKKKKEEKESASPSASPHRRLQERKEKVSQQSFQQDTGMDRNEETRESVNQDFDETEKENNENISSSPQQLPQEKEEKNDAVDRPGTEWSGEEDLNPESHRLSDFKELCKSVASLLHIENQEAAAMLTEPLSGRRDLVEGLDAEAIFDYLTQHGVLDTHTLQSLRSAPAVTQRNAALLQHVEREGHNAVALFINALRQSGQLHLASSLDNTRRIQPVSEGDYFEKQRHKGEVTIIIKVHALLIVVPERDSDGDVIDDTMLASPRGGIHQSYDNMLMMDDEPNVVIDATDDEDDSGKKKSFFCFCFPSRAKKQKEKKYAEQTKSPSRRNGDSAHKERKGAWSAKSSAVSSPQHSSRQGEPPEVLFSGDSRRNSGSPKKEWGVDPAEQKNGVKEWGRGAGNKHNKENTDPVIMEYNKQMELIRLKAQKQRSGRTRTTSQSSAIVMCEKWKSGGQYFRKKLTALCEQFECDLQTYIIKYIEQDRGTLVLSVWTDRHTMFVSNICMTRQQVRQLHKDHTSGALRERFDALLRTNQCLQKLDILDIDLHIVIDDDQFQQALRELA